MWYNFDVQKFGKMMLPPLLRGGVLLSLIKALLQPLVWLVNRFRSLRKETRERLSASGQGLSIVEVIRRRYNLQESDVYIVDAQDDRLYLHLENEEHIAPWVYHHRSAASAKHIRYQDEGIVKPDFYVYVPDYLEPEEDPILRLIEQYKPAGRKYQIIYYPYE